MNMEDVKDLTLEEEEREPVVKVENVTMKFTLNKEKVDNLKEYFIRLVKGKLEYNDFTALNNVSFEIYKGDRLAILGLNGAGKSTLLKTIVGVYKPTEGTIFKEGVIAPLLELGAGFDPNYTGRENIYLYGAILGYSREYIDSKLDEIIDFSELGHFIEVPVKNYSSGMRSRLGFSIATAVEPDILILDEVLSVGDAKFRKKSLAKVKSMFDKGVTVLFVSHSIEQVKAICNKAILLEHGNIIAYGDVEDVAAVYEEKTTRTKSKKGNAVVVPITDEEKKQDQKAMAKTKEVFENFKKYEDDVVKRLSKTEDAEKRYAVYCNLKKDYQTEKLSKDDFKAEVEKLMTDNIYAEDYPYAEFVVTGFEKRLKKAEENSNEGKGEENAAQ